MKKAAGIVSAVIIGLIVFLSLPQASQAATKNSEFLRIHIRADSNESIDQLVKFKVKTAVVEYLVPTVAQAKTKEEVKTAIAGKLTAIEEVANKVLENEKMNYRCRANVKVEDFPTRTYDGLTLSSGVYDALILELGSGKGDNWWCVVYPPLCFVGGESNGTNTITFKSKISELINNWKKERNAK